MRNTNTGGQLLSLIERVERLEQERRDIVASIRDVKAEAKTAGFDLKAFSQMLRERQMSDDQRSDWQAICETYRAALGMLDGTPLGDAARRRFAQEPEPSPSEAPKGDQQSFNEEAPPAPPIDLDAARARGVQAADQGASVMSNPYPAGDPHRAAWDEGWCAQAGSDGMDIPAAFRRTKPQPPAAQAPSSPELSSERPVSKAASKTARKPRKRSKK